MQTDLFDPDEPSPGANPWPERALTFSMVLKPCAACGDAIPKLGPVVCQVCLEDGACTICGERHRAWCCPLVRQARLEMAQAEQLMHTEMVETAARAIKAQETQNAERIAMAWLSADFASDRDAYNALVRLGATHVS